jgi:hypothetical protein
MIRFEKSEALQRKIRQDAVGDLGIHDRVLACEAIREGRIKDAIELIEYDAFETQDHFDGIISMVSDVLSHLATLGEEEIEKAWRKRYPERIKDWLSVTPGPLESLQRFLEYQRSLQSNLTVFEEPDKYVIKSAPCGSGGRLKRTDKNVTKNAYPWSWGKRGIPYYCTHCCMAWEIIPIELRGYPLKILMVPDKSGDPCIHYLYKKPELIPEKYFTRIGKTKTIK